MTTSGARSDSCSAVSSRVGLLSWSGLGSAIGSRSPSWATLRYQTPARGLARWAGIVAATGLGLGLALVGGVGCERDNARHCGNQNFDATCAERDPMRRWCNLCTADNDGCQADRPDDSECQAATSTATTGGDGAASTDDGPGVTSTSGAGATGSSGGARETTSSTDDGGSSSSGGDGPVPVCGDGMIEGDEKCDGTELDGESCRSLSLQGGTLACNDDCTWDVSGCDAVEECGDGVVQGNEQCDGTELNGMTCADYPQFGGGELTCVPPGPGGCEYNTTNCEPCLGATMACRDDLQCCNGSCNGLGVCL